MRTLKSKLLAIFIIAIGGFCYYYVKLPAINLHSVGFWKFIIVLGLFITVAFALTGVHVGMHREEIYYDIPDKRKFFAKLAGGITLVLVVVFIVGSILSSPIINSKKYHDLIQISDGDFEKDIKQISYQEIPLLDKDSAALIGNRKMGSMVEYISQFEVANDYTQINYKNRPVRVTPLKYGNLLKWFTNRKEGIPAYIKIDMASQDAECIKLKEGMKYSEAEHFSRNIYRYLRFQYPTYIFDTLNFELNEEGEPVYICPVKDYTIGLFGGETISKVVIVNAITGEDTEYPVDKVPTWVDRVYSAELLISYYNYYGTLRHGYWNSVLAQKDCLRTTNGYNYIALDNDVWVYTGVTSVGNDQSNVGFVLMNQRTGQTKYYSISGAEENSAMSSAEGKVQHLNYEATFPILLNIAGKPTYFICLKDSAGLVKQYAMVNIEKYTIVATGNTIEECEKNYTAQLESTISSDDSTSLEKAEITGKIAQITEAVVDGNSHFYLLLEGNEDIFDVTVGKNLSIIKYQVGSEITLTYEKATVDNTAADHTDNTVTNVYTVTSLR